MAALTFTQALVQAEAQARSTLTPDVHERLSAAVALVKDGRVFQTSTGDWQVDSSRREGLTYTVNGTCSCDDHHFNKPQWCKHQLAMFLSKRVCTLMRQPAAPVVPLEPPVEPWPDNDLEEPAAPAPAPAPTPVPLPEAAASVNVRLTIDGRECQITLRDHDEGRLLARLHAVLARYPMPQPPAVQADATPRCPVHGMMKPSKKGKGHFCPNQMPDGTWCPSKGK